MKFYALSDAYAVMRDVIGGHEAFEFVKRIEPTLPAEAISFPPSTIPIGFTSYPFYDDTSVPLDIDGLVADAPHSVARARLPQWENGGSTWRFLWATHKGKKVLFPKDMATPHLFFALRMIYNHSVPPCFRVGEFHRYVDVPKWDPRYRAQAIKAFVAELAKRDDIICERHGMDLVHELDDMIENTKVILRLGL